MSKEEEEEGDEDDEDGINGKMDVKCMTHWDKDSEIMCESFSHSFKTRKCKMQTEMDNKTICKNKNFMDQTSSNSSKHIFLKKWMDKVMSLLLHRFLC